MGKIITATARKRAARIAAPQPQQPRARGAARVEVAADQRLTRLVGLRQSGSMKLLFPRTASGAMQAVAVNTAGGVTGGDEFELSCIAGRDAHLTLTTQAADRAYRAQPGQRARIRNHVAVGQSARVNWVPQETILYRGCALDRSLRVEMEADATLLLTEPLVFGRVAMGEVLREASFRDRIEIRRGGKIVYLDAMTFEGDVDAHLAHPTVADGAGALVSLIYIAPDAETHLAPLRALLPATAGASLIRDDTLVVRALAPDAFAMRTALIPILNRLTDDGLPRPWMI